MRKHHLLSFLGKSLAALSVCISFSACDKELLIDLIPNPRRATCSNASPSSDVSPYRSLVWWDEFDLSLPVSPNTDSSCFTQQPNCLRRLDWNAPWECKQQYYPTLSQLNKCVWNVLEGYNFWNNDGSTSFDPNEISVRGGALHLTLHKASMDSAPFKCGVNPNVPETDFGHFDFNCAIRAGAVNSTIFSNHPGFNVGAGAIEFRARISNTPSTWPALWMWEQIPRDVMTEIDLMETNPKPGDPFIKPFQTLVTWLWHKMPPENHFFSGGTGSAPLSNDFHTYGVDRYDGSHRADGRPSIKFYVDGCFVREIADGDPDTHNTANALKVDTLPMFLIMGEGTSKDSMSLIDQVNGADMEVDWVHVFN